MNGVQTNQNGMKYFFLNSFGEPSKGIKNLANGNLIPSGFTCYSISFDDK